MPQKTKTSAFDLIRSNIEKHGQHIYLVSGGGPSPRFAYTVGVQAHCGVELVLAGASIFSASDVNQIINRVASAKREIDLIKTSVPVGPFGSFSLRKVDSSWSKALMLGALDFYGTDSVEALQVVPDQDHWTLDIPNLEQPWSPITEPVWQWLHVPWEFQASPKSLATTNLAALRGQRITEAARWEEEHWELFAGPGPEVSESEARVVPLGTLLALDQSLVDVTRLDVGSALWRDSELGGWQRWGT
jgi:hypothetical protein